MVTLIKKINGSFKSKLKSHTPINIAVPKHLQEQIKRIPRLSLEAFKESRGTGTDWYNLMFRTKIGLDLALAFYTEEGSDALKEVHDVCLELHREYKKINKWTITGYQYETLLSGLEAIDQIQDETTRRDQLEVFKSSDLYVKKLIARINKGEDI